MEKKLRYLRDERPGAEFYYAPCGYQNGARPGQGAGGYGRKIATDYVARYGGRTRRIYVCCFSNSGTAYVLERGEWLIVDRCLDFPANTPPLPAEYRGRIAIR